jgi:hypothetical protein
MGWATFWATFSQTHLVTLTARLADKAQQHIFFNLALIQILILRASRATKFFIIWKFFNLGLRKIYKRSQK